MLCNYMIKDHTSRAYVQMYSQSEMLMFYVKKFSTHRSANSEKEILGDFDPLHNAYIDFCTPLADIRVPYNVR